MHDEAYSQSRFGHLITENGVKKELPLVLPHVPDHRRVIYTIYEYNPLLGNMLGTPVSFIITECVIPLNFCSLHEILVNQ